MSNPQLTAIAHDPDRFEAFYRQHFEEIIGFVTRRVRDPHLAGDLTAEVFLAAIDAAPSYRASRGEERAWLFGIARIVVASEHRRRARERRAHGRIEARRLLNDDDIERLQERIDAQARSLELFEALTQLPDGERAILELTALDGLTASEAAVSLGIRPVTARVRLHRARSTMRGRLLDDAIPPETRPMEA
ncbi:MAG: RNA polymerase sigma factor [Solirubrobacteraceae bacterium]